MPLSIRHWRLTDNFFEYGVKSVDIPVSYRLGNHADFEIRGAQPFAAFLNPQMLQIGAKGLAGMLEEHTLEMPAAPAGYLGQMGKSDSLGKLLLHK